MTGIGPLLLDGLVALLLLVVAVYCLVLDRRLAAVRNGQQSLQQFLAELTAATTQAERTIGGLKGLADGTAGELEGRVKQARALADELGLLVESGSRLAQKLESQRPSVETPQQTLLKALREAR